MTFDQSLKRYKAIIQTKKELSLVENAEAIPGSEAAGGLGFALLGMGASLVSGSELIANRLHIKEAIRHANLVITGEGQSDQQTLFGKAPAYVADLASLHDVPTLLLSGSITGNSDLLRGKFAGCFSIINKPLPLEQCLANAEELLFEQTKQIVHFVHTFV